MINRPRRSKRSPLSGVAGGFGVGRGGDRIDVDFKILTALKGWVGHAPQGRGALHIIILKLNDRLYRGKK